MCSHINMEKLSQTLTFVRDNTGFLPALFAFSLGPAASLRTWLAVKSLDPPVKVDEAVLKKQRRKRIFGSLAFLTIFLGTEFYVLSRGSEDIVDMFFRFVIGAVFQLSLFVFFADILRVGRWSAFRRPTGLTSWRIAPGTVSKPKVVVAALLATGINVGAYATPYRPFAVLVGTALLYRFMAQAQMRKVSIRMTAIALLSWLALTAVLSGGLIALLLKSGAMEDTPETAFEEGEVRIMMIDQSTPEPTGTMSAEVERYVNLILPFVWSAGPGFLIAVAYRFDYAQHLSLTGESAPTLDTLDTPAKRPDFTRGVIVPAVAPRRHRKPYYFSALFSWLLAQGLVTLFYHLVDVPQTIKEANTFDLMGLTLAIPLMVVGLVVTASIRGEMRSLWRYSEVWTPPKEEIKAAAEDVDVEEDEEGARDEILASYSDEKEEVAPEYTVYPVDVKA
ncbi:hypothetical protein BCR35DRAFT_307935 [Leucosporidium creatinivorum]|uniref:Uncharacterized protein n=1 Tax=Leucosporidium creatinivorum TaxID=106004 RepID=A0A1Y2EGC8_9BASI|nr:hypothetical protein BCR35DRAFT_307935 [Leucosporidium creatinivorum]